MNELVPDLIAVARLLGAAVLLCAPGAALCCLLYPGRVLDPLERVYLSVLASLCLLTLIGVVLLEVEGQLNARALAYWSAACTAAGAVIRAGAAIVAWGYGPRRAAGSREPPHGSKRSTGRTGPMGGTVLVREVIRVRGTRASIPGPVRARCYPVGRHQRGLVSKERRHFTPPRSRIRIRWQTSEALRGWCFWVLPRAVLLGIAVLTLVAYRVYAVYHRACDLGAAAGNGPPAAFSIPVDRLQEVQAALQAAAHTGGSTRVPFCVEDLGRKEELYRVEAWMRGRVGEVSTLRVSAGTRYCGELEVQLALGAGVPLDLYLYPVQTVVPLAHLRLWVGE